MSERTEVEVLLPLDRWPDRGEVVMLRRIAFDEARRLVNPGRVLGLVSVARAVNPETNGLAMKVRFAVEAPESIQPQNTSFSTS